MVVHIADKSSRKWTIGKVLFGTCNTYGNVKHVRDKTSSWFRQIAYTGDVTIHTSHQTHLIKGHHMINSTIFVFIGLSSTDIFNKKRMATDIYLWPLQSNMWQTSCQGNSSKYNISPVNIASTQIPAIWNINTKS